MSSRKLNVTSVTGEALAIAADTVKSVTWVLVPDVGRVIQITTATEVMHPDKDGNPKPQEHLVEYRVRDSGEEVSSQMMWAMPGTPAIAFLDGGLRGGIRQTLSKMVARGWSDTRIEAAVRECLEEVKDMKDANRPAGVDAQIPSFDPAGLGLALPYRPR